MFARLALPLALALLLVSCGGGDSNESAEPSPAADVPLDPLSAAAADLAERVGGSPDDVNLVSMTSTQWPDACLDLPEPDEVCDQAVTPGYRVVLELDGQSYTYHTDQVASVRYAGGDEPSPTPSPEASGTSAPDETLPPVIAAREGMAANLEVSPEEIEVLSVTPKEWSDACLGRPEPDEVCAQVMTSGYVVQLLYESDGSSTECTYNTDESTAVRGACNIVFTD